MTRHKADKTRPGEGPRTLAKADYERLAAFRHALRRFAAFSTEAARDAGLSPQQHQALLSIRGAPGRDSLSVGEIASHLLIRPHSAAELVDRLEQLGLARRGVDPLDHRRVLVSLTREAERVLLRLSSANLGELEAIRPTLLALLESLAD